MRAISAASPARISVIIVDNEDLSRALLGAALLGTGNIDIVGAFADGEAALGAVRRLRPQVVVLEVALPGALDGIQTALLVRREFPDVGIVWLSAYSRPYFPFSFQSTTGWAYLLETSGTDVRSLAAAIDAVANGFVVLDPEVAAIMNRLRNTWIPRLSTSQHDVLALMAQGLSNAGIAQALDVSEQFVSGQVTQIYRHLRLRRRGGVKHRRMQAVLAYLRGGAALARAPEQRLQTIGATGEPLGRSDMPPHPVLDQSAFVERVHEEITRCLRTRRHLSVVLLSATAPDATATQGLIVGPETLRPMAEDLARHIRPYDLVAVSGGAEVTFMFPEATCENTKIILGRLRAAGAALPRSEPEGSPPLWGFATWPADGSDPTALLETARHHLSPT
jgi:DNA-binding NarL/FixJ family response regulator/GGDEF domain-containing protein